MPLAGTGDPGSNDGPALKAQFLLPSALAFDARGALYITDAAAQLVRVLEPGGDVRTIAGSGALDPSGFAVPGGYKDGSALAARFDHPSGIAIAANGDVFVADTDNHVVRKLSAGIVTTYAGKATEMAGGDGPAAAARFAYPHQLAFDANGDLYVADYGNGLRLVHRGIVTTVFTGQVERSVTGVAIGTSPDGKRTLFAADLHGLSYIDLATKTWKKWRRGIDVPQGTLPIGQPYALAALDASDVVYTDLQRDEVKVLRGDNLQYLSGPNLENVVLGASQDEAARPEVHGPLAVAVRGDGRVVVANAGRRALGLLPAPSAIGILSDQLRDELFPSDAYRIAVVSNSFAYWAQTERRSIAASIDETLRRDRALPAGRAAKTVFFRNTSVWSSRDLIRGLLSKGTVDCVVLLVNPALTTTGGDVRNVVEWSALAADGKRNGDYLDALRRDLSADYASLESGHVAFLAVTHPLPWDLTPNGDLFATENLHVLQRDEWPYPPYADTPLRPDSLVSDYTSVQRALAGAVAASGVPTFDLWPAFREAERTTPGILFPTEDLHFSPAAQVLAGEAIAHELERRKPWAQ
jgi:hypothetical protein